MRVLPFTLFISFIIVFTSATNPHVVVWNTTHSYGPDGPWPVVTVQVGNKYGGGTLSWIDLHPGGIWGSTLLTDAVCNDNNSGDTSGCLAAQAGLYHNHSTSVVQFALDEPQTSNWESDTAFNMSVKANNILEGMTITALQGVVIVANSSVSAVDVSQVRLPDGTDYPTTVGLLSLGCPVGFESFPEAPSITGATFPGTLKRQKRTASNSFGLHYGSVPLGQVGSLIWGGYDQSRIVGDIGSFDLDSLEMSLSLLDIEIGVATGSSPFDVDSLAGLLRLNPNFNGLQPTIINPAVPYLFLSPETCSAIAQHLPVTLQPDIGLYTWNIADTRYQDVVKSPAYLAFVFQRSTAGNFTVKVPFQLLNLTLEAPIVPTPRQYFPCRPLNTANGHYFLGRSFLQAAYVGINWENNKWFLGQAPGPGVGASNPQSIAGNDTYVASDPISRFVETWADFWTPLSRLSNTTVTPSDSPVATSPTAGPSIQNSSGPRPSGEGSPAKRLKQRLSSGAQAGLGVGSAFGTLMIIGAIVLIWRKRQRRTAPPKHTTRAPLAQPNEVFEKDTLAYLETGRGLPHETGVDGEIHEI